MKVVAITNRNAATIPFFLQMDRIIAAKPDMMILNESDMAYRIYAKFLKQAKSTCDEYMVKLGVDTYYDAATRMEVKDLRMPLESLKTCWMHLKLFNVWVPVSSLEEAQEAVKLEANHLIVGNVFNSVTNPMAPAIGLEMLKMICESVDVPVYAQGGITPENAASVKAAGAQGVCITSSIMTAENPSVIIEAIQKI